MVTVQESRHDENDNEPKQNSLFEQKAQNIISEVSFARFEVSRKQMQIKQIQIDGNFRVLCTCFEAQFPLTNPELYTNICEVALCGISKLQLCVLQLLQ